MDACFKAYFERNVRFTGAYKQIALASSTYTVQ